MLTLLDKDGPYQLPTGWHEVSTAQFCATDPLMTVEARASYFAGRPTQVNGRVADALAWMLTPPPVHGGLPYPADLGQEAFLQVETIRALLVAQPLTECFAQVWATMIERSSCFGDGFDQSQVAPWANKCLTWPITDTYPAVHHCLTELQRLATKYAVLAEPDTTEAGRRAREAGADRLNVLGHYNTATAYAQAFGITLESAYQTPWESVAVWLYQQRLQAEINDQLTKNSQQS